ncbi:MAG: TIGR00341 family protein [Chloroflexi bacterium]|nr:TIGR00341 family protein [Chloroflexota bacterium]
MGIIQTVVQDNTFRPEDIPAFEQKLFFEGAKRRLSVERFVILLLLATIIATYGVLGDSTATVIGAMIVAPLMTPIMATAAGIAMGRLDRAIRSLLTVAAGVAGVIALSWLLATLFTGVISYTGNTQIVARISPRLIDLIVALASGVAGAFAMSREDVADSLPGVAIAISLVPPLCVVGIGLAGGQWDVAQGALLLFVTNFFAILLAGGGVFSLLGLSRAAMVQVEGSARKRAFGLIFAGVFIIMIPLGLTSAQVTRDTWSQVQATETVEVWAAAERLDVRDVNVRNDIVTILAVGENEPTAFPQLVTELEANLGRPLTINLQFVPSRDFVHASKP